MKKSRCRQSIPLPILVGATLFLCAAALAPHSARADSEVRISPSGEFSAKSLVIIQKSGNNLFTRATWGSAFIRVTVLIGTSTAINKQFGEQAVAAEVQEKHVIDVDGRLASGADSIIVHATRIKNTSLLKESKDLKGTIASIDGTALSFVLPNDTFGKTTVVVPASVEIKKGARQIQFTDLKVGDRILAAKGTYDYTNNTLSASDLNVFQDATMFKAKNFQGILKSIGASSLPTSAVITVEGTAYTVFLGAKTSVLNNKKAATTLKRFEEGDTVRFYGAIRQTNFTEIDAEVIRDLDF